MTSSWSYNRLDGTPPQPSPAWSQTTAYTPQIPNFSQPSPGFETKRFSSNEQYELLQPHLYSQSPPLSAKYPPEYANTVRRKSRWSWDWFPETLGILAAYICFAGMVVILYIIQEKPLPEKWPVFLSVNAVLSILVVSMKGALIMTIEECLSQLKWSWFRKDRQLADLIVFDEASRGPWGATRLIFSRRAWYLAYLGSTMVILCLALGPTVQQTVLVLARRLEIPQSVEIGGMPVCNTSYFNVMGIGPAPGENRVNLPVISAMYDGLLQTSVLSPLWPQCRTGNCTWETFQSLGIKANCQDLSSQLVYSRASTDSSTYQSTYTTITKDDCAANMSTCQAELPGYGLSLIPDGTINSTVDQASATEVPAVPQQDPYFYAWRAILAQDVGGDNPPPPIAVECSLHFAVYTYKANVTYGKMWEKIVNTTSAGSTLDSQSGDFEIGANLTLTANPCIVNGTTLTEQQRHDNPANCTYKIPASGGFAMANTLRAIGLEGEGSRSSFNRPYFSSDVLQSIVGFHNDSSLYDSKVGSFEYVNRAFQSLAIVLTNHVRGSHAACGGAYIVGTVLQDQVYNHVRWVWLAPTAVLLASCTIFFLAVMIKFHGVDVWKSSPLAFLVSRVKVDGRELSPEELSKWVGGTGASPEGSVRKRIEKAAKGLTVSFGPGK